jgi:hypothetical protein
MKKFKVDYLDFNNDLCHVWTTANDESDVEDRVKSEYWDVNEIIQIIAC